MKTVHVDSSGCLRDAGLMVFGVSISFGLGMAGAPALMCGLVWLGMVLMLLGESP